jgi:toxin-antitoxin system PIN domain toxin
VSRQQYLLDVNCLIALIDRDHRHYRSMHRWFDEAGHKDWGVCPFTEAGFVRVTTNPSYGPTLRTIEQATAILGELARARGYRYWPMERPWAVLTEPFGGRIFGHQQVTDAYLLGMAVQQGGVLVTFDKGVGYLAGAEYGRHVLLLE